MCCLTEKSVKTINKIKLFKDDQGIFDLKKSVEELGISTKEFYTYIKTGKSAG